MLVATLLLASKAWAQAAPVGADASASTTVASSTVTGAPPAVELNAAPAAEPAPVSSPGPSPELAPAPSRSAWFIGAYYRHNWIPSYALSLFMTRAPSVTNDGFGLLLSHRAESGLTAQIGLGYMPYHFEGAFTAKDNLIEDTEWVKSNVTFVHLTGSLLWPVDFTNWFGLDIGVGVDLGVFAGHVTRSEAYYDSSAKRFRACKAAHNPSVIGPDNDSDGVPIEYCDTPAANSHPVDANGIPLDKNGQPLKTNGASERGEQYNVRDPRVPPVMLFPMLPHFALRFTPHELMMIKLEFGFGVAQVWAGASIHFKLGSDGPAAPGSTTTPVAAVVAAPVLTGRVLGKLMDDVSHAPVGEATIKTTRALSALQSDDAGVFVVDHVPPGAVRFDVTHPDYEPAVCETSVPASGGDVPVHCFLKPKPPEGAISGQVKDESGAPVGSANIELSGPVASSVSTNAEGLFAVTDAPAGTYRIRVDAEGYLMQLVQLEVGARETATPQILLIKKPATSSVAVEAKEIFIKQQINFASNSAEIGTGNDALMREIADAMLRNEQLASIEIQGHTDNQGGRAKNQALSQARAEAVRAWLVHAGVAENRLVARGYGQDAPLVPNLTPQNRAKNRRVQFIILNQSSAP